MTEPRVLIYDIEVSPDLGWVWRKYQADVIEIDQDWYMLSFAYKWLGEKTVKSFALPDFKLYDKDPTNDRDLCMELWMLMDEADIVVAHNGNRYDQVKSNARFLVHGFDPPSPYREVDTLKVARNRFKFTANNLDELCRQLNIGRKAAHTGFKTWKGCMTGDPKSWATMVRYNKQDVRMLEELYLKLLPYMTNHPNMAVISGRPNACPKCNSEEGMMSRGTKSSAVTSLRQYQCKACGAYSSSRLPERVSRPNYK